MDNIIEQATESLMRATNNRFSRDLIKLVLGIALPRLFDNTEMQELAAATTEEEFKSHPDFRAALLRALAEAEAIIEAIGAAIGAAISEDVQANPEFWERTFHAAMQK